MFLVLIKLPRRHAGRSDPHMGHFLQDGKNEQTLSERNIFDQTVPLFQLFSTVLKRLYPLHSKNVFVLVLAHLEPELKLFS